MGVINNNEESGFGMQTAEAAPKPQFQGTDADQKLAEEIFQAFRFMGRLFPRSAPIRVALSMIVEFYHGRHPEESAEHWNTEIDRVLSLNDAVFAREEEDGQIYFVTTLAGTPPEPEPVDDQAHMLAERFEEPVPLPEEPAEVVQAAVEEAPEVEPLPAAEVEAEVAEPVAPADVPAEPVEAPAEELVPAPSAPEPAAVDLAGLDDTQLAALVTHELRQNMMVANFGDLWMAEDRVPRLSRGDLRRIREYLLEREEPLTDETLLQDALGYSPTASDYDVMRFAVNFRLSREHREFEFVGTSDQRLWTTTGLPTIGTTKRKASEIGTDYRFLRERQDGVGELDREATVVDHVLTFYEYQYGVLPYDAVFAALFPPPVLPDQRAAVLVFESPQTYGTFFVELRYPTGNRGGYVAGLEEFFHENLVPGALISIERSENNGRYLIEYLPVSAEDQKLLQLDEKKGRYVFRPTTFYCATQANMVLSENRFPRLANVAPLEERVRRRPELALAATFERIGEPDGPRFMAMLDDLLAAVNIERPMDAELIRSIVHSDEHPEFSVDPDVEDVFYYQPASE